VIYIFQIQIQIQKFIGINIKIQTPNPWVTLKVLIGRLGLTLIDLKNTNIEAMCNVHGKD